ncbi:MAG: tetratricopeptide repeat protein [Vicinamibacterales bacterium]
MNAPREPSQPFVQLRRDVHRHLAAAMIIGASGAIVAALMLPRSDELLAIRVKSGNVKAAQDLLDQASSAGLSNAASVTARSEVYLQQGHVDAALGDMERYVSEHPDDVRAWRHLGVLYRHSQRLYDYLRVLEHINDREPSKATLRELQGLYAWTADERREAATLVALITRGDADPDDYARAARLEASAGHLVAAAELLERLRLRAPEAFDFPLTELYASVLVDTHRVDQLAQRIRDLPSLAGQLDDMQRLASSLAAKGRPEAALALLDATRDDGTPRAVVARAQTALGTAEQGRVFDELRARADAGTLPLEALGGFVDLAVAQHDRLSAWRAVSRFGDQAPPDVAARLAAAALADGDRGAVQAYVGAAGDGLLGGMPLLAADLAFERGDRERAAEWIETVDRADTSTATQIAVAQLERREGRPADALARYLELATRADAPAWLAGELVAAARDSGAIGSALVRLGPPTGAASAAHRSAWARLALSANEWDALSSWLATSPTSEEADLLRDVAYLASDAGATGVAVVAARRLHEMAESTEHATLLGQMLLADHRSVEAVDWLRPGADASEQSARAFDGALFDAYGHGAAVADELRTRFRARLAAADLPAPHVGLLVEGLWAAGERASVYPVVRTLARADATKWLPALAEAAKAANETAEAASIVSESLADARIDADTRRQRVQMLVDLGASDVVLAPHLAGLAESEGGSWVFAYDERLERLGQSRERVELWTREGLKSDLTVESRRGAVYRLLDLEAKSAAVRVLEQLADTEAPDGPSVSQLMFLWGPRPSAEADAWLVRRLSGALTAEPSSPAVGSWMTHLVNVGRADRALTLVPLPPPDAPPSTVDAWVGALRAVADRNRLEEGLTAVLESARDLNVRRIVARASLEEGLSDLAQRAYLTVTELEPADLDASRWLGTLAFYGGRVAEARTWLTRYEAQGGEEAEPLYQLGELLTKEGDVSAAHTLYRRAHDALERHPTVDTTYDALLANVLVRLDARDEARRVFERLLAVHPSLDHVRADYGAALLAWGDYDRARTWLQIP